MKFFIKLNQLGQLVVYPWLLSRGECSREKRKYENGAGGARHAIHHNRVATGERY
jgi:hypothetical protein